MSKENMRIWEALGKTDPAHTKQFTRAGGFKGTAVKPMWANKQMTEFFGPCGIGWGMDQPRYDTVSVGDEVMVYCTVGMWYTVGQQKGYVYGVGGDKVLSQVFAKDQQGRRVPDGDGGYVTYPQSDDEAFKKAYTDALSNAMKFIGVAADVHMGMFDDSKYVQEVRAEFEAEAKAAVYAEVEQQKAQSGTNVAPITLKDRFQAANDHVDAQTRAAKERTELAEKAGIFSLEGDQLRCIIRGIQKKESTGAAKKPYISVTFNGRLPTGGNFASCFDKELFEAIDAALDKECVLKMKMDGKYPNIIDVVWIAGVGEGAPFFDYKHQPKITDQDIPF